MATLKDIIDEIYIESQMDNSIFRNSSRFMMNKFAYQVLKNLNMTFWKNTIGWSLRVPDKLFVKLPQDYEMFVRAYLLDCNGKTIEISSNPKVPSEIRKYLIDCDGSILSEECNQDLYTDCIECDESTRYECDTCCGTGRYQITLADRLFADIIRFKDSYVQVKQDRFEFSHDLEGMAIMIEYIGNGLTKSMPCDVKVEEEMREAIDYYIKFKILEGSKETLNDSQYYKNEYIKKKRLISLAENPLTLSDLDFATYLKSL